MRKWKLKNIVRDDKSFIIESVSVMSISSKMIFRISKKDNSPNPVVIAVDEDGKIKAGFIDPLSVEGGPVELPRDDCGISRVDDVCERFDGPKLP